jgi:hypothetical protein
MKGGLSNAANATIFWALLFGTDVRTPMPSERKRRQVCLF